MQVSISLTHYSGIASVLLDIVHTSVWEFSNWTAQKRHRLRYRTAKTLSYYATFYGLLSLQYFVKINLKSTVCLAAISTTESSRCSVLFSSLLLDISCRLHVGFPGCWKYLFQPFQYIRYNAAHLPTSRKYIDIEICSQIELLTCNACQNMRTVHRHQPIDHQ